MKFKTIALWLGVMIGLFILMMVLTLILGINNSSTDVLLVLQALQTIVVFALPTFICLWIYKKPTLNWLRLDKSISWKQGMQVVFFMLVAMPGINLILWLNAKIPLPDMLTQFSEAAELLTKKMIMADNWGGVMVNVFVLALLPGLCEEICFRGTIQQYIKSNPHVAIWTAAIIFSAIHMQFEGFFPRMIMGAAFGYMFYWSGSLWLSILAHFTNNAAIVIMYNVLNNTHKDVDILETFGTGDTLWIGIASCVLIVVLFVEFRRTTCSSLDNNK